jgi:hypothetical protein
MFSSGSTTDSVVVGRGEYTDRETVDGCEVDGREDDRWECKVNVGALSIGFGMALCGTPQSAHIFSAVGLSPGGFLLPHTSHSQLLKESSTCSLFLGRECELAGERCKVIFGEDLKRPA